MESKRITLIDKEDYRVELEYNEFFAILHLPSVTFTPSVYKDMKRTINEIDQFVKDLGYSSLWTGATEGDMHLRKFAYKMGFELKGTAEGYDVYERIT